MDLTERARLLGGAPSWVLVPALNVRDPELFQAVRQLGAAAVMLRRALSFPWRYVSPARLMRAETSFRVVVLCLPRGRDALSILYPGMVEAGIIELLRICPGERVSELFDSRPS